MKDIMVSGKFKLGNSNGLYTGQISFREDVDSIYYSWKIVDSLNNFIAGKRMNVYKKQIPKGVNIQDFAITHSVENIKRYRIDREKIIVSLEVIGANLHLS